MLDKCRYCALSSTWKPSYDRYLLSDDRYKPSVFEMIDFAAKVGLDGIELIHPQQVNPQQSGCNKSRARRCLTW